MTFEKETQFQLVLFAQDNGKPRPLESTAGLTLLGHLHDHLLKFFFDVLLYNNSQQFSTLVGSWRIRIEKCKSQSLLLDILKK